MTTICLAMIVRNEAHVIRRCLSSVKPFIHAWCIVDTGSDDDTTDIITEFMSGIPGTLHRRPWVNFGVNRTESLDLARNEGCDFTFVIDADEELDLGPGPLHPTLKADSYMLTSRYGGETYTRKHLVRSALPWRYVGPVHEYVTCDAPGLTEAVLEWPQVIVNPDGARSRDPDTYLKDAALLEAALKIDPNNARHQFYLAQSYFDAGWPSLAIDAYERRIAMGDWDEEIYISKYKIGRIHHIAQDWPKALAAYLDAWDFKPRRAEPLFQLASFAHHTERRSIACELFRIAAAIPLPDHTSLFVERSIYDYLLPIERAVACYWAGRHEEAVATADGLLASGKLPESHRALVENNRRLSLQALGRTEVPEPIASAPVAGEKTITLVNVHIPGYIHSAAYDDLICSVKHGLIALGYDVEESTAVRASRPSIIFGAHLSPLMELPSNSIIYNTEHIIARAVSKKYFSLLRKHHVWDYSSDNAAALAKLMGKPVRYVPFGYVPELTRIIPELTRIVPAREHGIDVLFYGSINERRQKVLDDLRAAGLKVEAVFGVYGAERDALIARAKVVLNMHYYMPGHFEALRVGYLLANSKAVLMEVNPGETVERHWTGGTWQAPYERLTARCLDLLSNSDEIKALEQFGFEWFSRQDEPAILREALAATWGNQPDRPTQWFDPGYDPTTIGTASATIDNSPSPFDTYGTVDIAPNAGYSISSTGTIEYQPPGAAQQIDALAAKIMAETLAPSRHLIIGSGKSYDPTALNIDIDRRWKPDVVADISDPKLLVGIPWFFYNDQRHAFRIPEDGPRERFTKITASHVLEHIPNLVQAMTNCLDMLADGGEMHITVPYDLSYGAWQDPTHVRAFNERSWLYYTDWWWYVGFETHRFDLVSCEFWTIDVGRVPASRALTPRAVDEMHVVLRKRALTDAEKAEGLERHGSGR